jgi:transcriptional regulator with XRE-family HTH domain
MFSTRHFSRMRGRSPFAAARIASLMRAMPCSRQSANGGPEFWLPPGAPGSTVWECKECCGMVRVPGGEEAARPGGEGDYAAELSPNTRAAGFSIERATSSSMRGERRLPATTLDTCCEVTPSRRAISDIEMPRRTSSALRSSGDRGIVIHLNGSSTRYNVAAYRPEVNTSTVQSYHSPLPARPRTFGSLLKIARINANLDQAEVAKRIGVNRVLVSKWENDVHRPAPENLNRLTELYGLSLEDLEAHESSVDSKNVPRGTVGESDYVPDHRRADRVPERPRGIALTYLQRLVSIGLPTHEIESVERMLFDDRFAIQFSRRHHIAWSEEDWIAHIESIWLHVTDWLSSRGIVP